MDRADGRFSIQNNDFKKYSYHDHSYARFHAHRSSLSGNQHITSKSTVQSPYHRSSLSGNHHKTSKSAVQFPDHRSFLSGIQNITSKSTSQSPDKLITKFPTPADLSKCSLMKSFQVADPHLKKLLLILLKEKCIQTHWRHAINQGRKSKWLTKNFTDVQVNTICKNPDCENFDLTLKIRCIELFIKDFKQTVISNENVNLSITTTTKRLKNIRDNLCHNREHMTKLLCLDKANTMKVLIGDLLEILHTWDKDMDIFTKKKETDAAVDKIMNGVISEEDFIYMCLQEVLNSVVEPALNKVTQKLCFDKNKENFKDFFLRNDMKWKMYKKGFFDEEKAILESNSEEVRPDVSLHTKIIEICKEWHLLLKNDSQAKNDLSNIIKKIKGIRNNISHNMLSMSPTECNREAHGLGNCLEDLRNFIQRKILDIEDVDTPIIDISQIYIDIDFLMSAHNHPFPSDCFGH